jgi:hypothetical protein
MGVLDDIAGVVEESVQTIGEALKAAWQAISSLFGSSPVGGTSQPCPAPISQAQADQLFKDLSAQSDIPFDYPDDCCYTRAQEMCEIMQRQGIPCGKVWNYAHDFPNDSLRVDTSNNPKGYVTWRYHVAPVVPVQGDDGIVRQMVLDPSTFDRPVTVDEWVKHQDDLDDSGVHQPPPSITDSSYYYRGPNGEDASPNPSESEIQETLAGHRNRRDLRNLGDFPTPPSDTGVA